MILEIMVGGLVVFMALDTWISIKLSRQIKHGEARMDQLEQRLNVHSEWIDQKANKSDSKDWLTGGCLGRRDIGGKAPREG